jgi:intracellular sulfur oxidation DsrE/DsrF family protein
LTLIAFDARSRDAAGGGLEPRGKIMQVVRNLIAGTAVLGAAVLWMGAHAAKPDEVYKVALHVADNDAAKMNLALNNVNNIVADFKKSGRKIDIQVVTYGPGLHMFLEDTSPVKARIQEMSLTHQNVTFAACNNTFTNMSKAEKKPIKVMSEAKIVPSGVVHLVELQRQGYAYVRP